MFDKKEGCVVEGGWYSNHTVTYILSIMPYMGSTVVMSGLVTLVAIWSCLDSKNKNAVWLLLCFFSWTLGLSRKWGQLKSFLLLLLWYCRCSTELAQLVPFPFSWGRYTHYSIDCMISVTISRCYKDVSFFTQLESGILCL